MTLHELNVQVALGEESRHQFKPARGASLKEGSEKILALIRIESALSARQIAIRLGITPRAVEKQIARLRKEGRLKRVGPAKGGHWDVIES